MFIVRAEMSGDIPAIHRVNEAVFGQPNEAILVDALRRAAGTYLSHVAERDGKKDCKGLRCEYPVPDDAFMVGELVAGALNGRTGLVKYRSEFAEV